MMSVYCFIFILAYLTAILALDTPIVLDQSILVSFLPHCDGAQTTGETYQGPSPCTGYNVQSNLLQYRIRSPYPDVSWQYNGFPVESIGLWKKCDAWNSDYDFLDEITICSDHVSINRTFFRSHPHYLPDCSGQIFWSNPTPPATCNNSNACNEPWGAAIMNFLVEADLTQATLPPEITDYEQDGSPDWIPNDNNVWWINLLINNLTVTLWDQPNTTQAYKYFPLECGLRLFDQPFSILYDTCGSIWNNSNINSGPVYYFTTLMVSQNEAGDRLVFPGVLGHRSTHGWRSNRRCNQIQDHRYWYTQHTVQLSDQCGSQEWKAFKSLPFMLTWVDIHNPWIFPDVPVNWQEFSTVASYWPAEVDQALSFTDFFTKYPNGQASLFSWSNSFASITNFPDGFAWSPPLRTPNNGGFFFTSFQLEVDHNGRHWINWLAQSTLVEVLTHAKKTELSTESAIQFQIQDSENLEIYEYSLFWGGLAPSTLDVGSPTTFHMASKNYVLQFNHDYTVYGTSTSNLNSQSFFLFSETLYEDQGQCPPWNARRALYGLLKHDSRNQVGQWTGVWNSQFIQRVDPTGGCYGWPHVSVTPALLKFVYNDNSCWQEVPFTEECGICSQCYLSTTLTAADCQSRLPDFCFDHTDPFTPQIGIPVRIGDFTWQNITLFSECQDVRFGQNPSLFPEITRDSTIFISECPAKNTTTQPPSDETLWASYQFFYQTETCPINTQTQWPIITQCIFLNEQSPIEVTWHEAVPFSLPDPGEFQVVDYEVVFLANSQDVWDQNLQLVDHLDIVPSSSVTNPHFASYSTTSLVTIVIRIVPEVLRLVTPIRLKRITACRMKTNSAVDFLQTTAQTGQSCQDPTSVSQFRIFATKTFYQDFQTLYDCIDAADHNCIGTDYVPRARFNGALSPPFQGCNENATAIYPGCDEFSLRGITLLDEIGETYANEVILYELEVEQGKQTFQTYIRHLLSPIDHDHDHGDDNETSSHPACMQLSRHDSHDNHSRSYHPRPDDDNNDNENKNRIQVQTPISIIVKIENNNINHNDDTDDLVQNQNQHLSSHHHNTRNISTEDQDDDRDRDVRMWKWITFVFVVILLFVIFFWVICYFWTQDGMTYADSKKDDDFNQSQTQNQNQNQTKVTQPVSTIIQFNTLQHRSPLSDSQLPNQLSLPLIYQNLIPKSNSTQLHIHHHKSFFM